MPPAWPDFLPPADLAPGDARALATDWSRHALRLHTVRSAADPYFEVGYRMLHAEFDARGELETRDVLVRRLEWTPAHRLRDCALLYDMMLLFSGDTCVAIRDHTAIHHAASDAIVVHLSHVLVTPAWRRAGLAALLRALPLQTARACADAIGRPDAPVVLAAEMDAYNPALPESVARSRSYERAGFLKVDPRIAYRQPDFRPFAAIDATGGPRPVPLDLVLRRIGREDERELPAPELHAIIRSLYEMYATGLRPHDVQPCFDWLARLAAAPAAGYALMPPTTRPLPR